VPKGLLGKITANEWVNAALAQLGGKGGGRPQGAQGQGSDIAKAPDALAAAEQFAQLKL
jgi:alanyl-tRNA synthetase